MTMPYEDYETSEAYATGVDGESDFESPDFEATRRNQRYQAPATAARRRPGGGSYYNGPTSPTSVTQAQLRSALQKVQEDIGRVAAGVQTTNNNLNDLNTRTARNLTAVRAEARRSAAQQGRATEDVKQLAILSALLGGGGTEVLLPLLAMGMASGTPQAPAADGTFQPAPAGGDMTFLAIALASGGFGKKSS